LSKVHSGMDQSDVVPDLRSIVWRDLSCRANPCGWGVLGPSDLACRPADSTDAVPKLNDFPCVTSVLSRLSRVEEIGRYYQLRASY
jgi:hypothetical protein